MAGIKLILVQLFVDARGENGERAFTVIGVMVTYHVII